MINYINKTKKIKIYKEQESPQGVIKYYIHPRSNFIKAYIRQLMTAEALDIGAVTEKINLFVVINNRDVETDYIIEYKENFYKIISVDRYDFNAQEIQLKAVQITPLNYVKVVDPQGENDAI